jgi:hypothetical protein
VFARGREIGQYACVNLPCVNLPRRRSLPRARARRRRNALSVVWAMTLILAACSSGGHSSSAAPRQTSTSPLVASTTAPPKRGAQLSARLTFSSLTVAAGSSTTARLTVDNPGPALHATGPCSLPFEIVLANKTAHQLGLFNACGQRHTIPTGETAYELPVSTGYSECVHQRADGPAQLCTADGKIPSLPAGDYRATLADALHLLPKLPSQQLRVVAVPAAP